MNEPQESPEAQTPPAKVLLPLGTVVLIGAILALKYGDVEPVASAMLGLLILMGVGLLWQGFKNLKRDRK